MSAFVVGIRLGWDGREVRSWDGLEFREGLRFDVRSRGSFPNNDIAKRGKKKTERDMIDAEPYDKL